MRRMRMARTAYLVYLGGLTLLFFVILYNYVHLRKSMTIERSICSHNMKKLRAELDQCEQKTVHLSKNAVDINKKYQICYKQILTEQEKTKKCDTKLSAMSLEMKIKSDIRVILEREKLVLEDRLKISEEGAARAEEKLQILQEELRSLKKGREMQCPCVECPANDAVANKKINKILLFCCGVTLAFILFI